MSKVEEIARKIAQAILTANSVNIYSSECECILKVLCELRDLVPDLSNKAEELDSILLQLNNLCNVLDSFKDDKWLQTTLKTPIEDILNNIKQIMESLTALFEKAGIKLTNKYIVSEDNIYEDLSNLFTKLSGQKQPEIKPKLDEINQHIDKLGKPLLSTSQRMKDDLRLITDSIELDDYSSDSTDEKELDEVDERFNFHNVQKYKMLKSDYTQDPLPTTKNEYYSIYEGKMRLSKENVTIMVLKQNVYTEEKFKRFVNVLTGLKHPNLDSFVGYVDSPLPYTVITRRKGEKLSTILKQENEKEDEEVDEKSDIEEEDEDEDEKITLKPGFRTIIAYKIASAMAYLHSNKITHRDLCSENVMIDESNNPRITNFATSRVVPENILTMTYRPGSSTKFIAPEINDVEGYNQEVDVFSFSGILYELLTNKLPFYERINPDFESLIRSNERPLFPNNVPQKLKSLIELCWKQNPSNRPSFADIVQLMLKDSITFPQDENSDVVKQFYASKKINNIDIKICFRLLKKIREEIKIYAYKEEINRIFTLLQEYQNVLQSSEYAKKSKIKDENFYIQINNMKQALQNLFLILQQTQKETWLCIALNTPSFEIPNDLHRTMEQIYISLKSIGFKVTKFEFVDNDLIWDLRFAYYHFYGMNESAEAEDRMFEIEEFMNEKKFDLQASQTEIKNVLSDWKNYEVDRSDFDIERGHIGKGTSGKVFRATQISTGKKVAVKKIEIDNLIEQEDILLLRREIALLVQLDNQYLIKFVGFNIDPSSNLWIITEFISGGDLWRANIDDRLSPFQKTKIAFEIAQGMEYLKSKGVIHRDLKTLNILLDGDLNSPDVKPKICDFGYARVDSSLLMTKKRGTPYYMAPEVIEAGNYDFKADVFSFGMVLWELYAGEPPFNDYPPEEVFDLIKSDTPLEYPKPISDGLKDLIEEATNFEPSKRPSFTEIINKMLDYNNKIAFPGADPAQVKAFYEQKSKERNS